MRQGGFREKQEKKEEEERRGVGGFNGAAMAEDGGNRGKAGGWYIGTDSTSKVAVELRGKGSARFRNRLRNWHGTWRLELGADDGSLHRLGSVAGNLILDSSLELFCSHHGPEEYSYTY